MEILKKKEALNPWENLQKQLETKRVKTVWVAGPENQKVYPDIEKKLKYFESYCKEVIWWTAHPLPDSQKIWQISAKTFFEKDGTFINFAGIVQQIKAISSFVPSALSLSESVTVLKGEELQKTEPPFLKAPMKSNHFTYRKTEL